MKRRVSCPFALLLALLVGCGPDDEPGEGQRSSQTMTFPGADWVSVTPASEGVDPAKLQIAIDYLKGQLSSVGGIESLIIVRNGHVIWQGSDTNTPYLLQSATKSFTSTALGLLIEDGKAALGTLARDHDSRLAAKYGGVTLRHFATMTSGYDAHRSAAGGYDCDPSGRCDGWDMGTPLDPIFAPGSKFRYWDEAMMELGYVLTRIAGGAPNSIPSLLKQRIADPIGMHSWSWDTAPTALGTYPLWCGGVRISSRDLARFGHLFLNRGSWAGKQLINASWVTQSTSSQVPLSTPNDTTVTRSNGAGHYGFNWWVNTPDADGQRKFPGADPTTYAALGYNVNVLFVIPAWNMVVARTGKLNKEGIGFGSFLQKLGQALVTEAPPPALAVTGFTLINASTDADIRPLAEGATIDLAQDGQQLNVRAAVTGSPGSVVFTLSPGPKQTENVSPYAMAGDTGGNYAAWSPAAGSYALTAVPYSGSGGQGTPGTGRTVHFTVVKSGPSTGCAGARIAVSADGNQHDKDDWAATAATLALLGREALQGKLVHYDFSSHLGDNNPAMASQMATSAIGGAEKFGFDKARFFDDQTNLAGAVNSLRDQINASSASNRLCILVAGPMEVVWRGVNASDPSKRGYVNVISHGLWNDTHADTTQMTHTRPDVVALGVNWVQIPDQNPALDTSFSAFAWMQTASDGRLRWVYDRMVAVGRADVSDSGMAYHALTGDDHATPEKYRTFFGDWVDGAGAPAVTGFTLVNSATDADLRTLASGGIIDLSQDGMKLNIRANVSGAASSVKLALDALSPRVEVAPPFALAGDNSGNYLDWTPPLGQHTLTAAPYSSSGLAGTSKTITFSVVP